MLPPLPPAHDSLPGTSYKMGDWATITMKKKDYRGVIAAFRYVNEEDQSEPLALFIHESPRCIPHKHKYIGCEWVRVSALKQHMSGVFAELLTHDNSMIREYFSLVQKNGGKIVVEELWTRNERVKKVFSSTT